MITKIFERTAWVVVSCMHRPSWTCDVSKALVLYCTWLLVTSEQSATHCADLQVTDQHLSILDVVWSDDYEWRDHNCSRVLLFVQCDRSSQHTDIWWPGQLWGYNYPNQQATGPWSLVTESLHWHYVSNGSSSSRPDMSVMFDNVWNEECGE